MQVVSRGNIVPCEDCQSYGGEEVSDDDGSGDDECDVDLAEWENASIECDTVGRRQIFFINASRVDQSILSEDDVDSHAQLVDTASSIVGNQPVVQCVEEARSVALGVLDCVDMFPEIVPPLHCK